MTRTVFWSWQSDLSNDTNRQFIKNALQKALKDISSEAEIDERLELDHDTKGLPGLVSIPDAILAKIEKSDIFVADLTPVAISNGGKFVANPNILIELGYAKKAIGSERMVLVWNTAYPGCKAEFLPFDLRHRRAPIGYKLSSECDSSTRRIQLEALSNTLSSIFQQYQPKIHSTAAPEFAQARGGDPSAWFEPNEVLRVAAGTSYGDDLLRHSEGKRGYGRLRPLRAVSEKIPRIEDGDSIIPLGRTNGRSWGRTRGGFISYSVSNREGQDVLARTSTMYFRNSAEIWGVDDMFIFEDGDNHKRLASDYILFQCNKFIRKHLSFYADRGVDVPLEIEFGINELSDVFWPRRRYDFDDRGALEKSWSFVTEVPNTDPKQSTDCARLLMTSLFDVFGMEPYEEEKFLSILSNWRS